MSNVKISELPAATAIESTSQIPVVVSGVTKRATALLLLSVANVKLYGATGDGATDDTTAVQNALNSGAARIYFPTGTYLISSGLSVTWTGQNLLLYGDGSAPSINNKGTVLKFTGSGALLTYDGSATTTNFRAEGIKFYTTNSTSQTFGLKLFRSFINSIHNCAFEGFSFVTGTTTSAGLYVTGAATGQALLTRVTDSDFSSCYDGIFYDKTNSNVLSVKRSRFHANTGRGIRGGDYSSSNFSFKNWFIAENDFEGNTGSDIHTTGGAQAFTITGNYFEWTGTKTPITIGVIGAVTPINAAVKLSANTYNGVPASSAGFIDIQDVDGLRVTEEFISTSVTSSEYLVKDSKAGGTFSNAYVAPPGAPSGTTKPTTLFTNSAAYSGSFYDSAGVATSWTPDLRFGSATTGITYTTQLGKYFRYGDLVYCFFRIVLTSKGSATGTASIGGLPFTPNSSADQFGAGGSVGSYANMASLTGGVFTTMGTLGGTEFFLTTPAATTSTFLTDAYFQNNTVLNGIFVFRA